MNYRLSTSAAKALARSNKRKLIYEKIEQLAADPSSLATNVIRMTGTQNSRLRVQDWRIIFRLDEQGLFIIDIAPRGGVYERRS